MDILELHNANCDPIRLQPCFCSPKMAESEKNISMQTQMPVSTNRPSLFHNQTVIITCFKIILLTSSCRFPKFPKFHYLPRVPHSREKVLALSL